MLTAPQWNTAAWLSLAGFFGLCLAAAGIGAWLTAQSVRTWYSRLVKPAWTPPEKAFVPVWFLIHALMAIAAWRIFTRFGFQGAPLQFGLFFLQLGLSVLWSALFFAMRRPGTALIEIGVLWLFALATLFQFGKLDATAGWMLAPYLAWVTFGAALNFAIWRRNPQFVRPTRRGIA